MLFLCNKSHDHSTTNDLYAGKLWHLFLVFFSPQEEEIINKPSKNCSARMFANWMCSVVRRMLLLEFSSDRFNSREKKQAPALAYGHQQEKKMRTWFFSWDMVCWDSSGAWESHFTIHWERELFCRQIEETWGKKNHHPAKDKQLWKCFWQRWTSLLFSKPPHTHPPQFLKNSFSCPTLHESESPGPSFSFSSTIIRSAAKTQAKK